jgi:hypothetical protein
LTVESQVPAILYKYVRPERLDVLTSKRIRFTQPTATNDLFELKPIFDSMVPDEDFESEMTPSDAMLEKALQKGYMDLAPEVRARLTFEEMMTLVRSRPDVIADAYRDVMPRMKDIVKEFTPRLRKMMTDGFSRMIGILSLTDTANNQAMWAHHADSHKGFVLAFDSSSAFFNRRRSNADEFHHLRRVQYMDRTASDSSLMKLTGADIFLTKSSDWAYEREWRMIAPLGTDINHPPGDDEVVLVEFPPSAILEVIVGARSTTECRTALCRAVTEDKAYSHVILKEAFVPEREPTIGIRALDIV